MFGFSLTKLLTLAILILIVWYGFKYAARVEAVKQAIRAEAQRRRNGSMGGGDGGGGGGTMRATARPVEDLVKCPRCGSFVAAVGAANCGKPQCPWGL